MTTGGGGAHTYTYIYTHRRKTGHYHQLITKNRTPRTGRKKWTCPRKRGRLVSLVQMLLRSVMKVSMASSLGSVSTHRNYLVRKSFRVLSSVLPQGTSWRTMPLGSRLGKDPTLQSTRLLLLWPSPRRQVPWWKYRRIRVKERALHISDAASLSLSK